MAISNTLTFLFSMEKESRKMPSRWKRLMWDYNESQRSGEFNLKSLKFPFRHHECSWKFAIRNRVFNSEWSCTGMHRQLDVAFLLKCISNFQRSNWFHALGLTEKVLSHHHLPSWLFLLKQKRQICWFCSDIAFFFEKKIVHELRTNNDCRSLAQNFTFNY